MVIPPADAWRSDIIVLHTECVGTTARAPRSRPIARWSSVSAEGRRSAAPAVRPRRPTSSPRALTVTTSAGHNARLSQALAVMASRNGRREITALKLPLVPSAHPRRSEEHTSELQSQSNLVCRLLLEKKKKNKDR